MTQYIDKSALVAELEDRIKRYDTPTDGMGSNYSHQHECKEILSFINSLEVKEIGVDLDLGSSEGDVGVKTIWYGDKIVSSKSQKGEEV